MARFLLKRSGAAPIPSMRIGWCRRPRLNLDGEAYRPHFGPRVRRLTCNCPRATVPWCSGLAQVLSVQRPQKSDTADAIELAARGCRWYRTADPNAGRRRTIVSRQRRHRSSSVHPAPRTSNNGGNAALVVSRVLLLLRPRASAMRMPVGRCISHRRGAGQARSRGALATQR